MPVQPPEIVEVDSHAESVACDGGGALGHPRTWYRFGSGEKVTCGYCDREFVHQGSTAAAEAKAAFPDIFRALG